MVIAARSSREAHCYSPQPLRFSSSLVSECRANRLLLLLPTAALRRAQPSVKEPSGWCRLGLLLRAGSSWVVSAPPEDEVWFGWETSCARCLSHFPSALEVVLNLQLWFFNRFLIYSLAASPSSLSCVPSCPRRALLEQESLSKPRCSPERSSSPCQAGRALRGERCPAWGQGRHPRPRCPPPLASLRDMTFVSVTVGCLESLLH